MPRRRAARRLELAPLETRPLHEALPGWAEALADLLIELSAPALAVIAQAPFRGAEGTLLRALPWQAHTRKLCVAVTMDPSGRATLGVALTGSTQFAPRAAWTRPFELDAMAAGLATADALPRRVREQLGLAM